MQAVQKILTLPPVIMTGGLFVIWAFAELLPNATYPSLALKGLGFALVLFAGILAFTTIYWFIAMKTPVMPDRTPRTLITTGPFRLSRNPIYLAFAMTLLGVTIYLATPIGLAVVASYIYLVTKFHIKHEEHVVKATFGNQADTYFATVRRWF